MTEHPAASSKKSNLPQLLNTVRVQNTHQERAGARILMADFNSSGAVCHTVKFHILSKRVSVQKNKCVLSQFFVSLL